MSAEAVGPLNHSAVVAALQKASAVTGSDFDYLLKTAVRESGLKPQAQAATSSASGLFQFVEQTWLGLVKEYGGKYGLGSYASSISKGSDGRYRVSGADRQAVLSLRNDPQTAALMAGEYAGQCKNRMEGVLGRSVSGGELYAAHFLGADSASRLIKLCEASPNAPAANAFPQAAGSNRSVFFHSDGSAKTMREVYEWATQQPSNFSIPADGGTASPAVMPSRTEYILAMAQLEKTLLASALLSEPSSSRGFFSSGLFAPSQPSGGLLDLLTATQGVAPERGAS